MNKTLNIIDHIVMILTSLLFVILALCLAVLPIAKSKSFYNHEHKINNVEEILETQTFTGLSHRTSDGNEVYYPLYDVTFDDIKEATNHIIDYLYHSDVESMQFQVHTDEGDFDFFTEQAIVHMADVKVLFIGGIKLSFICLALFVLGIIYIVFRFKYIKRYLVKTHLMVVLVCGIITLIAVVFCMISFDAAFYVFHLLIFPDKSKVDLATTFSYYDTLTNVLTTNFFVHIALVIVAIFVVTVGLSVVGCLILRKFLKKEIELQKD